MNKYEEKILKKCEEGTYFVTPYTRAKDSVTLSCKNGHYRTIIPSNLTSKGNGVKCLICAGESRLPGKKTHEEFIKEVSIKYPSLTVISKYSNAKEPIEVSCELGHVWSCIPSNLLSRESDAVCPVCTPRGSEQLMTIEEGNIRLQEHYPFLSIIEYTGSKNKTIVLDARCGNTSEAYINNLMEGRAWKCPHCEPHLVGTSAMEQNVLSYIKSIYDGWIIEQDKVMLNPKHVDIILPDLGLCIEFDGTYYHSKKDKNYHLNKTLGIEAYEYQLIHIFDAEWIKKRKIVESRLLNLVGKSTKIYARKCTVKEISYPKEFLDTNHIQGAGSPSSINCGLFLGDTLVAVMTFSKSKFNNIAEYELVRYCSILNTTVIGGAGKLLNFFKKNNSGSIMSYSDKRWSKGNLYIKLGFEKHHTSAPGYKWYKNGNSLSRYQTVKKNLPNLFPNIYTEGMTEDYCLTEAGYTKVYDCGNDVWLMQ